MAADRPPTRGVARWVYVLAVAAVIVVIVALVWTSRPEQAPTTTSTPSTLAPSSVPPSTESPTVSTSPTSSPVSTRTPTATVTKTTAKPAEPTAVATTKPPVPVGKKADVDAGLTARVSQLESVQGQARGPGEVAGPAIRATVVLSNNSPKTINLSNTVINLYYTADETPASVLSGPGARSVPRSVKPGRQAKAVIVFGVPKDGRDVVLITVDYSVRTPVVAFKGPGPS